MLDMIEHEIFQLTKKQALLYFLFCELELERIKLPSIFKMDSKLAKGCAKYYAVKLKRKQKS